MANLEALCGEIQEALARHQEKLTATLLPDRVTVAGIFVCQSEDGPFDRFEIHMDVSALFPQKEPRLQEVGGRIPRTFNRHVFTSTQCCCLGLWEAWLLKTPVANFESYLLGPVTSYFVSQSIFELTGEWPFGEQGHSPDEIAQTYADALGLEGNGDLKAYLQLLTAPLLGGNPSCPCGSGERLRACHWRTIREQRRRIPAYVRKDIADRLTTASKK